MLGGWHAVAVRCTRSGDLQVTELEKEHDALVDELLQVEAACDNTAEAVCPTRVAAANESCRVLRPMAGI